MRIIIVFCACYIVIWLFQQQPCEYSVANNFQNLLQNLKLKVIGKFKIFLIDSTTPSRVKV